MSTNSTAPMLTALFWVIFLPIFIVGMLIPLKPGQSPVWRMVKIGIVSIIVYIVVLAVSLSMSA